MLKRTHEGEKKNSSIELELDKVLEDSIFTQEERNNFKLTPDLWQDIIDWGTVTTEAEKAKFTKSLKRILELKKQIKLIPELKKVIAAQSSQIKELENSQSNLSHLKNDPAVKQFSVASSIKTPPFSQQIQQDFSRCLCCGTTQSVTRAHLIPNSRSSDFSRYNNGYDSPFDPVSPRNHIPLCGNKGTHGTCHHLFDEGELTLLYNPFQELYFWHCPTNQKYHNQPILHDLPAAIKPYRRVLADRARHDYIKKLDPDLLTASYLVAGAHASEKGEDQEVKKQKLSGSQAGSNISNNSNESAAIFKSAADSWNIAATNSAKASKEFIDSVAQFVEDRFQPLSAEV